MATNRWTQMQQEAIKKDEQDYRDRMKAEQELYARLKQREEKWAASQDGESCRKDFTSIFDSAAKRGQFYAFMQIKEIPKSCDLFPRIGRKTLNCKAHITHGDGTVAAPWERCSDIEDAKRLINLMHPSVKPKNQTCADTLHVYWS